MTKHLSQMEIITIMEHLNHEHVQGRNEQAAGLAIVEVGTDMMKLGCTVDDIEKISGTFFFLGVE